MKKILIMIIACLASMLTMYGQDKNWRFAVVGDTHVPQAYTIKKIIPSIIENKVEVVLFAGDLIQGGKGKNSNDMYEELHIWNELIQPLKDAGIKILAVRGNHEADVRGNNITPWNKAISSDLNFTSVYKNITFIGIDNYINGEHTVDTEWLNNALKKSDRNSLIVPFGHEPAFTCDTFHPICLDANPNERDRFWGVLEKYNIDYYFCGHSHQYNHCTITHNEKTIHQIVSGGGGGSLQPKRGGIKNTDGYNIKSIEIKSETGYILVDVVNNELFPQWVHIYDKNVPNHTKNIKRKGNRNNYRKDTKSINQ